MPGLWHQHVTHYVPHKSLVAETLGTGEISDSLKKRPKPTVLP